jgi:MFS family permease
MSETAVTRPEPPKAFRWVVLVLISLAMFGNYYVYDSISPLADVLKAQLGFTDANIGLLNAIYSFPNIVMVLLGGIVIDRIGTRRATLLFGVLCFAGAALTALSGTLAAWAPSPSSSPSPPRSPSGSAARSSRSPSG